MYVRALVQNALVAVFFFFTLIFNLIIIWELIFPIKNILLYDYELLQFFNYQSKPSCLLEIASIENSFPIEDPTEK